MCKSSVFIGRSTELEDVSKGFPCLTKSLEFFSSYAAVRAKTDQARRFDNESWQRMAGMQKQHSREDSGASHLLMVDWMESVKDFPITMGGKF